MRLTILALLASFVAACGGEAPTTPSQPVTGLAVVCTPSGGGHQCRANARLENDGSRDVTNDANWTSSNPGVASVDSHGLVTHVANGQAEIRATYHEFIGGTVVAIGVTATSVAVTCAADATSHRCSAIAQFSNGTSQEVSTGSTWASSNPAIAQVDSVGRVTHLGNGQVEITARFGSVVGGTVLTLSGVATVESISVSCAPELEAYQCGAVARMSNGTSETVTVQATWVSSNTTVATVDAGGRVRTRTTGRTEIRATYRGVTGAVTLDVVVGLTGSVVINEFVTRTDDGSSFEFVEVRNDSSRAVDLGGWRIMTGRGTSPQSVGVYFAFPAGTTLDSGCHYMVASTASMFGVAADSRVSSGLEGDSGIGLLRSDGTIADQVGMHPNAPYKEGTSLADFGIDDNRSYSRVGNDTNNNAFDFARQTATPMNRGSSCSVR